MENDDTLVKKDAPVPSGPGGASVVAHLVGFLLLAGGLDALAPLLARDLYQVPQLETLITACQPTRKTPRILFLGDSVLLRTGEGEADSRPLPRQLEDLAGANEVLTLARAGWTPRVFRRLPPVLATLPRRPALVILPLNLRLFGRTWQLSPQVERHHDEVVFETRSAGFVAARGAYLLGIPRTRLTPAGYQALPVEYRGERLGTIGEYRAGVLRGVTTAAERRLHWAANLGGEIDPDLGMGAALEEAVVGFTGLGITTLTYVTPVNHEAAARFLGPEFATVLKANVESLRRRCEGRGALFLDLSQEVGPDGFLDHLEHLKAPARARVAARLHETIRTLEGAR